MSYHPVTQQVLVYCATPRTMAEIIEHAGNDWQRARFAVYNLRRRGLLVNLHGETAASRAAGLFVVAEPAAREDVQQGAGMTFSAMAAFWGRGC